MTPHGPRGRAAWQCAHRLPLLLVALAGVLAGCSDRLSGTPIEPPRAAPDLGALRISEQRGKVVVLTWGFTSCPDVCPLTLSQMRAAYRLLGDEAQRVTMAFVTVDPERDSPERLRAYVGSFERRILPVHLEGQALADALSGYGVSATKRFPDASRYKNIPAAAAHYSVDHTAGFVLADKQGRLRVKVPHDAKPEALVGDIRRLLAEPEPPPVRIEAPVAHLTPTGVGAVYLRIVNPAGDEDRLLAVETRAAQGVEMHESVRSGDMMRMVARSEGFVVPARGAVELARGGKHLMLLGVSHADRSRPLPLTLRFERSGALAVDVPVAQEP
jgi:protein SCO1/2